MGEPLPVPVLRRHAKRRPTVLDLRFRGDAWVEAGRDGKLAVRVGNFLLAALPGSELDLPHFNGLLSRLRQRPNCRA
jgi:hypothetical protein